MAFDSLVGAGIVICLEMRNAGRASKSGGKEKERESREDDKWQNKKPPKELRKNTQRPEAKANEDIKKD